MAYLIDADVLIQAKNQHYGFDFCPGFWDWLVQQHAANQVFSVQKIGEELTAGNDQLASWADLQGAAFFLPPDVLTTNAFGHVSATISTMPVPYSPAALNVFLGSGDYYLIAHAHAHGLTVVTHEVGQQGSVKRVKIPDACAALNVLCISPFQMLRTEGARLIL